MQTLDELFSELERISAEAVDQAAAGDIEATVRSINERGAAVLRLEAALKNAPPASYTEWNRLIVIHFQGKRILEHLAAARMRLGSDLIESERERALLDCVNAVAGVKNPATIIERA
jgi:hypothetical protein